MKATKVVGNTYKMTTPSGKTAIFVVTERCLAPCREQCYIGTYVSENGSVCTCFVIEVKVFNKNLASGRIVKVE